MLREKQAKLAEVEAKIAELQKTYDDSMAEKQKLERNIATTAARLKRAAKLTTALGDEQVRWSETVDVSHWNVHKLRPWSYKTFCMLNSAEHDIFPAYKFHITNNCKFCFAKHSWA